MVKEITYCIAQQRDSNASVSDLPIFKRCKAKHGAGRYWLDVYDIERDGRISALPAVKDEMLLRPSTTTVTVSCMPEFRVLTLLSIHSFLSIALYSPTYTRTDGGNLMMYEKCIYSWLTVTELSVSRMTKFRAFTCSTIFLFLIALMCNLHTEAIEI